MQPASKKTPSTMLPLLWVMLFDHTSINITFPVITLLFFDVQSSLFAADSSHAVRSMWYGLCVAVPHVVNMFMTPLLSMLSDVYGRKKIILLASIGTCLFALLAAGSIILGMLSLLFVARIIQGAFSRTNPVAQAMVGDMSDKANKVRNMGYLQLSISLGAFIGPVLGGYFAYLDFFAQLNFSLPFFIAAGFALVACWIAYYYFSETALLPTSARKVVFSWQPFIQLIRRQSVWRISLVLLLSQISWSMYYQMIPPILKGSLGFDAQTLGLFVGLIAFWLSVATGLGIRLFERYMSLHTMLLMSLYLVLLGLLLTLLGCYLPFPSFSHALIWLSAIPIAVGDVIAYSCLTALYSNVVTKEEQGKVMGVCFVIVSATWSLTALLGGFLISYSNLLPLWFAPFGVFLAILFLQMRFKQAFRAL